MAEKELYVIQTKTRITFWQDFHYITKESAQDFLSATQNMCDEINSQYDTGMECRLIKRLDAVVL